MKENRKYRQIEKDIIFKVQLDSGLKDYEVKDVFLFWTYEMINNWQEKKESVLPYIGKVDFEYMGDQEVSGGRKATGKITIELCDEFLKMVGQIVDGDKSDFERKIERRIKTILSDKVE